MIIYRTKRWLGNKGIQVFANESCYVFHLNISTDNTATILTQRSGYSRMDKSLYLVPVVIADGDFPVQSSTNMLMIRVCSCDRDGNKRKCEAEAFALNAGLSTGALVAILLCIVILLSKNMLLSIFQLIHLHKISIMFKFVSWFCKNSLWPCCSLSHTPYCNFAPLTYPTTVSNHLYLL